MAKSFQAPTDNLAKMRKFPNSPLGPATCASRHAALEASRYRGTKEIARNRPSPAKIFGWCGVVCF